MYSVHCTSEKSIIATPASNISIYMKVHVRVSLQLHEMYIHDCAWIDLPGV